MQRQQLNKLELGRLQLVPQVPGSPGAAGSRRNSRSDLVASAAAAFLGPSSTNNNNNQRHGERRGSSLSQHQEPRVGLPLLQVWPSDSPRRELDRDDGQTFVFPEQQQHHHQHHENVHDSGIDSIQASPSPGTSGAPVPGTSGPSPGASPSQSRRPSFLHPNHARLQLLYQPGTHQSHHQRHHHHHRHGHHHHHHHHQHCHQSEQRRLFTGSHQQLHQIPKETFRRFSGGIGSPDRFSMTDNEDLNNNNNNLGNNNHSNNNQGQPPSPSSSTTSSLRSIRSSAVASSGVPSSSRRRSSRYSMFDPVDLEYALLRAAARGSVGPYSLSESLHKLTFTQSLAFPALAGRLAQKQQSLAERQKGQGAGAGGDQLAESGMNTFAKVVTALILVLVSVLVFGVVYKFVRT